MFGFMYSWLLAYESALPDGYQYHNKGYCEFEVSFHAKCKYAYTALQMFMCACDVGKQR